MTEILAPRAHRCIIETPAGLAQDSVTVAPDTTVADLAAFCAEVEVGTVVIRGGGDRAAVLELVRWCHDQGITVLAGPFVRGRNSSGPLARSELDRLRNEITRAAKRGFDGCFVRTPSLASLCRAIFEEVRLEVVTRPEGR